MLLSGSKQGSTATEAGCPKALWDVHQKNLRAQASWRPEWEVKLYKPGDLRRSVLSIFLVYAGITARGYSRQELFKNFKEAMQFHLEEDPKYVLPLKPSSRMKAKEHQQAAIKESIKLGGEEDTVGSVELRALHVPCRAGHAH